MTAKTLITLLQTLPPDLEVYTVNGNERLSRLRTVQKVRRKDRLTMDFEDGDAPKGDYLETMP